MKTNKKSKRALFCLVALLLLLSGCGAAGGDAGTRALNPVSPFSDVGGGNYTRGTLENGVYVNSWADIRFAVPDGFKQGDDEQYAQVEAEENTECGLYLTNQDGSQTLFIGFQKLSARVSAENYMQKVAQNLKGNAQITVKEPDSFVFTNLGGHEFVKGVFRLTISGKTVYQSYFVREQDNCMIFVVSTSASVDKTDSLANLIRACD